MSQHHCAPRRLTVLELSINNSIVGQLYQSQSIHLTTHPTPDEKVELIVDDYSTPFKSLILLEHFPVEEALEACIDEIPPKKHAFLHPRL